MIWRHAAITPWNLPYYDTFRHFSSRSSSESESTALHIFEFELSLNSPWYVPFNTWPIHKTKLMLFPTMIPALICSAHGDYYRLGLPIQGLLQTNLKVSMVSNTDVYRLREVISICLRSILLGVTRSIIRGWASLRNAYRIISRSSCWAGRHSFFLPLCGSHSLYVFKF